jgi:hypothetical protein
MADPGWYRDPQDPAFEAYFDGYAWTGHRRPIAAPAEQQWPAPPAPPAQSQPPAQPSPPAQPFPPTQPAWTAPQAGQPQPQWQPALQTPPLPPAKRRRKPLILALAAVAAVAAGLITWFVWPDDKPALTYEGKPIANPSHVLTTAESELLSYVHDRHGVANDKTRCYFSQPKTPAAGTKKTDVTDALQCGPVLFVDGDTARPYVSVALTTDLSSGNDVTLTPPYSLNDLTPQALDEDVRPVRPDGEGVPSGAGGLTVPTPPPADRSVLISASLGLVSTPTSLDSARMVGKDTGVRLNAAGEVPRYGVGEDARSAPKGQKLIAFQLTYSEGDVSGSGSGQAEIVIDSGTPRDVPETSGGDDWDVVAIDPAASAVLRLRNGGYTQTLSLPDGKPGRGNLAVLARRHRTEVLHRSAAVPVRFSNSYGSASGTFHAKATFASLDFWIPGRASKHAKDPSHAILSVHLTYTDPDEPGTAFGFDPQLLRLKLPNGKYIRSRNVAKGNYIYDVFDVPATFTKGIVQITGSERIEGVTLTVVNTVNIALSIPAG